MQEACAKCFAVHVLSPMFFCFLHSIFPFWFLVTFGDKFTKIQKYYVIFVYILQDKMGKTEKNRRENHATKNDQNTKTKRSKYGMNETLVHFFSCDQQDFKFFLPEPQSIWGKLLVLRWLYLLYRDIHIECSKQIKWKLYFYRSGQRGPFWAELKLL